MRQLKISKSVTNRETASIDKYLFEIGKIELITLDEEVSLAQRIRAGDQQALEKLTKANLRFVVSVAKQYQGRGLSLPDLINEGNLGLIKAARRFDETRGFKFISYAVCWIRQGILQALAEQSRIVRLPLNQVGLLGKIKKASSIFEQRFERPPTAEEIATETENSLHKVEVILEAAQQSVSVDAPLTENGDNMLDTYYDEEYSTDKPLINESLQIEVRSLLLSRLDEKGRNVIEMFYGIDYPRSYSLEEIGEKINLTREQARQIKEKSLRQLKIFCRQRDSKLKEFL